VTTGKETHKWAQPFAPSIVAFSADRRRLYFGYVDGTIGHYDLTAVEPRRESYPDFHTSPILSMSLSPDGTVLATTDARAGAYLWNTARNAKSCQWQSPILINHLAFAPDGRHLALAGANGVIYILRLTRPR
jgi:WD40 repeat protein